MHGRPTTQSLGDSHASHPNRWRILGVLVHGELDRLVGVTRAADQHHLVVVRQEVGEGDAQGGFVVSDEDTDRVGAHAAGTTRRVGGSSDGHRGDATRQQPPAQAHEPFLRGSSRTASRAPGG